MHFFSSPENQALKNFVTAFNTNFVMKEVLENKIRSVAVNIRKIRESKDYTQDYLAVKLAISQNAYSKIELGYTKITVERLFQIAQILEVNPVDLLNITEDKPLHVVNAG
jgi:DNA-binding Xre family transcriptional regulator